ncbi:polysaccharide deacetylase family protein [Planosporangium flavigriseum]|uniref:NodB homology domain-containing protein n=1 Tax=Planosporangium flavigriseum TaxID=373681 RepID=A0A8J3LLF1_9ACTN|nr:polysaccharide deacetylase family protein [Planosporangium flavigriseum]NJC65639.1 polysaccharide deacetylase family protein [Planosporangium flavigriseum]GIG74802.1 hypothetical protein Pfl04_32060 [Planosporangium flavigriseum]
MFRRAKHRTPRGRRRATASLLALGVLATAVMTGAVNASAAPVKPFRPAPDCSGGYVALTYDDGPDPVLDPRLLDLLRKHGLRATFFVVGDRVIYNPQLVRRMAAEGHSVQAHSWDHPKLGEMPLDSALKNLKDGAQVIQLLGLPRPTFYRAPYHNTTEQLRVAAAQAGLTQVVYTVDTVDWQDVGVDYIVAQVATARPGGVINMHDLGRPETVNALPRIAETLRAKKMCSGRLVATSEPNPDGHDLAFYAKAVAW